MASCELSSTFELHAGSWGCTTNKGPGPGCSASPSPWDFPIWGGKPAKDPAPWLVVPEMCPRRPCSTGDHLVLWLLFSTVGISLKAGRTFHRWRNPRSLVTSSSSYCALLVLSGNWSESKVVHLIWGFPTQGTPEDTVRMHIPESGPGHLSSWWLLGHLAIRICSRENRCAEQNSSCSPTEAHKEQVCGFEF